MNASLVKWLGKSRDNLQDTYTGRNQYKILREIKSKSQQKIKWKRPRNDLKFRYKNTTKGKISYKIIPKDRKRTVK